MILKNLISFVWQHSHIIIIVLTVVNIQHTYIMHPELTIEEEKVGVDYAVEYLLRKYILHSTFRKFFIGGRNPEFAKICSAFKKVGFNDLRDSNAFDYLGNIERGINKAIGFIDFTRVNGLCYYLIDRDTDFETQKFNRGARNRFILEYGIRPDQPRGT
eukprot:TRINITY_DN20235_c0_g1_i1.p1 TRINITY_DN20235_c0_g1~~TRINITY_DN20235_c0_g1_i1.p1  ORF type:complete len:159 (-),score=8.13 TRINITY_DN20235_c0_g1_i1:136-612(-)